MEWLTKLYESDYFIVILLSIVSLLTLLFIIVALSGKKKDNNNEITEETTVAFEESNNPVKLETIIDEREENLNDIAPIETLTNNNEQENKLDETISFEAFTTEPETVINLEDNTTQNPEELLTNFNDNSLDSFKEEQFNPFSESLSIEQNKEEETLTPVLEINTEPIYDPIETIQTNIDNSNPINDSKPNLTDTTSFDPFAELELPKPANKDE